MTRTESSWSMSDSAHPGLPASRLSSSLRVLALAGVLTTPGLVSAAPAGTILPASALPSALLKNGNWLASGVSGAPVVTTTAAGVTQMTINQNNRSAILNWQNFNIGSGSEVIFKQPDIGARVLNRIWDADPSVIQGKITANGQVYLLNRNGILFDRGSQVNVATLLASTLNMKDADFTAGFSTAGAPQGKVNPFIKFEDTGWGDANGKDPSGAAYARTGTPGGIMVSVSGPNLDSTGQALAPASLNALAQGSVILIAPHIENRGVIASPDGQVILAAGEKAYLWQRNTEAMTDPRASALRGLMVEISADHGDFNVTSFVRNLGKISADRGNVSIAALAINQEGRVSAGSSAVLNGSVWLTARSVPNATATNQVIVSDGDQSRPIDQIGNVVFGKDAYTGTPLLTDSGRLAESDSYSNFQSSTVNADGTTGTVARDFRSWIHVVANKIENMSGSTVEAPGGVIELFALGDGARVLLDSGSTLSAAGDWVGRQISDNIISIPRLTSNDLQDAPLQKLGPLLGAAVSVDARAGSPLLDISKYVNNLERTVQDKATVGGDIRIEARLGEVIAAAGSKVDVSGGGFRYASGSYTTTKLIGADGKLYDIGSASPLRTYVGTTDALTSRSTKAGPNGWDVTTTYKTRFSNQPTYESGYVDGRSAGTLSLVAPTVVRLGDWFGGVTLGRYQVGLTDPAKVPQGGTFTLGDSQGFNASGNRDFVVNDIGFITNKEFDNLALPTDFGLNSVLPTQFSTQITLPGNEADVASSQPETYSYKGFQTLALNANQSIVVPAGVEVALPPGGSFVAGTNALRSNSRIELEAAAYGVAGGRITAPAGHVSFNSKTPNVIIGGAQFAADGSLLADGAAIDASGVVIADGRPASGLAAAGGFTARPGSNLGEYVINNVAALLDDMAAGAARPEASVVAPLFAVNAASSSSIVVSGFNVTIGAGADFSTMGGFRLGADNALTAGTGGEIKLAIAPRRVGGTESGTAVALDLGLYGYSLKQGAKLQLSSNSIFVDSQYGAVPISADKTSDRLRIAPTLFRSGGFAGFTLLANSALQIAPGTVIEPSAQGLQTSVSFVGRDANGQSTGLPVDPSSAGLNGVKVAVAGGAPAETLRADLTLRDMLPGERAPASVAFQLAATDSGSSLVFGEGARISTDSKASVSFSASGGGLPDNSGIELLGSVFAPGGRISASVSFAPLMNTAPVTEFTPATPDTDKQSGLLHVGPNAVLDTSGTFVASVGGTAAFGPVVRSNGEISAQSRLLGTVIAGGSISLSANNGRIMTDLHSLLDVSGTNHTLDMPTDSRGGPYAAQNVWSDAGSISVSSTEASVLRGSLAAQAGGDGLGGVFSLNFVRHALGDPLTARQDFAHRVVITQSAPDSAPRSSAIDAAAPYVTSRIAADQLNGAGFSSVALRSDDSIEFSGTVNLRGAQSLTLDAPILETRAVADSSSPPAAKLAASRVILTNTFGDILQGGKNSVAPVQPVQTWSGTGTLEADARLIDIVGSVTVNGLDSGAIDPSSHLGLSALILNSSGDVRLTGLPVNLRFADSSSANYRNTNFADTLVGSLRTPANIQFLAQQVYPTTESQFTIASQKVEPIGNAGSLAATDSGSVSLVQNPGQAQAVLSAAGQVFVNARSIDQAGTLMAPQGRLQLKADTVTFEPGSRTSVSLGNQIVPFGETQNGRTWYYDLLASSPGNYDPNIALTLTALGDKQIVASGTSVAVKSGAIIDLTGGGDVQAFEFVAGPGGSRDVLQASSTSQTWAIVPSQRLTNVPLDTHLAARNGTPVSSVGSGYNTIFISGVSNIADGYYALLDAHYATLPGAYQVAALAGSTYANLPAGRVGSLLDGTAVIAAYKGVAGSALRQSTTTAYTVRPGSEAAKYSELDLTRSSFFASQAANNGTAVPRLPGDAGGLTLAPVQTLELAGTLSTQPTGSGLAAQVDISAAKVAVVDAGGDTANLDGFVQIDAAALANINGSLLLGGTRSGDGTLTATATQVIIANDAAAPLTGSEILLAATDLVQVRDKASIDATAPGSNARTALTTIGDGALLRASAGGQLILARSGTSRVTGTIDVQAGSAIAGKSILLDATKTTRFAGSLVQPVGGALSISAGSVALGETANVPSSALPGLVLDNTQLAGFGSLDSLAIRSYSSIDLYGHVVVGSNALNSLSLDGREIAGFLARDGNGNPSATGNVAELAGKTLTLANSGATGFSSGLPDGVGSLQIKADRLILGAGDKGVRGFSAVSLSATGELTQAGSGSTTVAGSVDLQTPVIIAANGSAQALRAANYAGTQSYGMNLAGNGSVAGSAIATAAAGPGGHWDFAGRSVSLDTRVDAPSGVVTMLSLGTAPVDNVTLKSGAAINVAGYTKQFTDAMTYASAGSVALTAQHGGVLMEQGAVIDLSAAGGRDAGRLSAQATSGTVDIHGAIHGAATNAAAGSVNIDAATVADFTNLNGRLNAGGMLGERVFRQRLGDIDLAASTDLNGNPVSTIHASHVSIAADTGNIAVDGSIDVSGAQGGRVELYARNDATIGSTGLIFANGISAGTGANDPYANGGKVEVVAETGKLTFAHGALVDVSAGAKGDAGMVTFAAGRSSNGAIIPRLALAGTVKGLAGASGAGPQVIIRGDHSYQATDIDASIAASFDGSNAVWSDYAAFSTVANQNAIRASLSNLAIILNSGTTSFASAGAAFAPIQAGIEMCNASGDLALSSPWDLTDPNWNLHAVTGAVTLRAAGNLDIRNTLGLPDVIIDPAVLDIYFNPVVDNFGSPLVIGDQLPTGRSWSLRLAGGADTSSANPMGLAAKSVLAAAGSGDVTLRDDGSATAAIGKVRTGSGEIDIAVGRNLLIGGAGDRAVIYSAGIAQDLALDPYSRYTAGGGDIRIQVQGDAVGSMTAGAAGEFVNDWLRRTTLPDINNTAKLTKSTAGWWVYRPNFRSDIGSFGGGSVQVEVGGNILNLGIAAPTSGRANVETGDPNLYTQITAKPLVVRGGGNITERAGGNIDGGELLVGLGVGDVHAGGTLGGGVPTGIFVMGQGSDPARDGASIHLEATGDIKLQSISNPTILALSGDYTDGYREDLPLVGFGGGRSGFFTYSAASGADVISLSGNLQLGSAIAAKPDGQGLGMNVLTDWSSVAPPNLSLVAMNGDVRQVLNPLIPLDLFPSTAGQLRVLAGNSATDLGIRALNVLPDLLPLWSHPGAAGYAGVSFGSAFGSMNQTFSANQQRIVTSTYAADGPRYDVEALTGDIASASLVLADSATIRAGRDVVSSVLDLQNLSSNGRSLVTAGRDIVQDLGRYDGNAYVNPLRVTVAGPGTAQFQAGRNIDLGTSQGIVADGNSRNSALAGPQSARLIVVAGVSGTLDAVSVDALMGGIKLFGLMGAGNAAAMAADPEVKLAIDAANGSLPTSLDKLDAALAALTVKQDTTSQVRTTAAVALTALAAVRVAVVHGQPQTVIDALLAGLSSLAKVNPADGASVDWAASSAAGNFTGALLAADKVGPGDINLFKTRIQTTGGSSVDLLAPGFDPSRLASFVDAAIANLSGHVSALPGASPFPAGFATLPYSVQQRVVEALLLGLLPTDASEAVRLGFPSYLSKLSLVASDPLRSGAESPVLPTLPPRTAGLLSAAELTALMLGNEGLSADAKVLMANAYAYGRAAGTAFKGMSDADANSAAQKFGTAIFAALKAGNINAGLPSGGSGNLGITTQTGGEIRAYLAGDLNVNQSKILTAQGGDIVMYTSDGNIDAGRGALTSRNSSPPRRVAVFATDANGNMVQTGYAYLPPIDVAGSGIRTVTSDPDGPGPLTAPPPGNIFPFTPKGVVDAGEAGIASGGDLTIVALQVLNAKAISAAGASSGVPPVDTGAIGVLGAAPTTAATAGGEDASRKLQSAQQALGESVRPTIVMVEVLGFGNCEDGDARCR